MTLIWIISLWDDHQYFLHQAAGSEPSALRLPCQNFHRWPWRLVSEIHNPFFSQSSRTITTTFVQFWDYNL